MRHIRCRIFSSRLLEREHTDETPHHCDLCDAAFSELGLKSHTRVHAVKKPYQCELCDLAFSRLDSLKKHKR